jgi:TPR repeat protein
MRSLRIVLLAILALVGPAGRDRADASEHRVALVVGNANYSNAPHLATPANDAADIAAALTGLGFDVTLRLDTGIEDLRLALRNFSGKSAKAEFSVVYFAGYSVNLGTDGYLIPVDAQLSEASAFRSQAIPLRAATRSVAGAKTLGMVILDAMRGNPFAAKFEGLQGNPDVDASAGTLSGFPNVLLIFATEPTRTAPEGDGRNSALAAALLKYLPEPDLEINFLFRNVRDAVRQSTQQKQTPYMYGQLSRERVFLNAVAAVQQPTLAAAPPDPSAVQPCDELASAPEDAGRNPAVKGVKLEEIKTGDALTACSEAVKQFPDVNRFHYELGRSLFAAKDYPAAVESYKRAYELGNTRALYALGAMYDGGIGVDKDPVRARFYYEIAAEMKFAPAIVSLGLQHERGVGVPADPAKALSFYRHAADLGDARAINKLGVFAEKGLGVSQDAKKARAFYEKSAAKGDEEAMVNLARCYANGIGGRKDVGEARRWLGKAALAGSAEAKRILADVDGRN